MNQGKLGEKAIALVLPTLLHKGVGSKAEEVRAIRYELVRAIRYELVRAIRYEWVRKFSFNHLSSFKSVHPSPYLSLYSCWNNYLFWGTNVLQTHKMHRMIHHEIWNGIGEAYLTVLGPEVAPLQTSFGVVRHAFISLCGGRSECVTNEAQRTSAGGLDQKQMNVRRMFLLISYINLVYSHFNMQGNTFLW